MSYTELPEILNHLDCPVEVGQLLGTVCVCYLITSPPTADNLLKEGPEAVGFELITVPKESKLLVVDKQDPWFKVVIMGSNEVGWFEKTDTFALHLICQKP